MLLINSISRLIFPEYCFGCRKLGLYVCPRCRKKLVQRKDLVKVPSGGGKVISAFYYKSVFQNLLRGAKYYSVRKVLYELADIAYTSEYTGAIPDGVLIPVPIHAKRRQTRGFNQAEILVQVLAREAKREIDTHCVRRVIHTPKQARLTREERMLNLKGAFVAQDVPKKCVIVDDVFTTGATCLELSRVLKSAGAEEISICTLAR